MHLEGASGRSISRILSSAETPGRPSIYAVYPGLTETSSLSSLLDLAPGGGYQAAHIAARAGGLLHHLFTLTLTPALSQKEKEKGEGSLFSVALSGRLLRPGISPAPRSMECGLSSIPTSGTATVQPT
jgi:hypothetical protein